MSTFRVVMVHLAKPRGSDKRKANLPKPDIVASHRSSFEIDLLFMTWRYNLV